MEGKRIDFLLEELRNPDWVVREDAVELLAEVADPRAVGPLIEALDDEDSRMINLESDMRVHWPSGYWVMRIQSRTLRSSLMMRARW